MKHAPEKEPETEARLRWWANAAVAVAVLLTVFLSFLSWRAAQQATETADWVARTHEVMTLLESTLRHTADVETGGRGFAETGSASFLEPYVSGRQAVVEDLRTLRLLLVSPDQLQRLNVLEKQARNQVGTVDEIVATRKNTGKIPAMALFEHGKQAMDAVRITVKQMEDAHRGLLASRIKRARTAQHSSLVVIALGSLLGVIFLSIAGMTVRHEIGVSARARAQIKTLNAALERRVEQRTAALESEVAVRKKAEERLASLVLELARQAEDLVASRADLEAQTSMLKLVLESMGEGLIAADRQGHFLLWNDAAKKLMGRAAIDLPTEQWTPHYELYLVDGMTPCPPDRLPLVRALQGESVKVELMVRPPDPEPEKLIEVTARPLKDARGNLRGGVAVVQDITERKLSEAALAQKAEQLRHSQQALETQTFMLQSVLDSMVEGLIAADERGKIILWNPAAAKIMGLGPTNLDSGEWSTHYGLFLPDTVTPISPGETPLERTLRGETGTTEIFVRHDGLDQGLWLETNGSPLINKEGAVRGGVLAFRDITRRKADELEIRKLNEDLERRIAKRTEQLEATNRELEAFSYSISHDLGAPLRHIAGFARILLNDFGPGMAVEAREHVQRIEDAVRRMGLLVDGLLKMAVLRRQSLRLSHSELNPIVDEVISMMEPESTGREVEWRIAKLPALDCDPILMTQVFQNLLGNALKYTRIRAKAVIEVGSIQRPGEPPVIFVRDNGAGFNMKYAERLFGVFQRFHTESEFEGTGVGLATVHRIIQKHEGMIWAEAEVDQGATFFFALQASEQIGTTLKVRAAS